MKQPMDSRWKMKLRNFVLMSFVVIASVANAGEPAPRDAKVSGAGLWEAGDAIVALDAWTFVGGALSVVTEDGVRLGRIVCLLGEEPPPSTLTREVFMEVQFDDEEAAPRSAAYAAAGTVEDPTSRFALIDDAPSPCQDDATRQLLRSTASLLVGVIVVQSDCDSGPCVAGSAIQLFDPHLY